MKAHKNKENTPISRSNDISSRILRYVSSKDYRPQHPRRLARSMGIQDEEYGDFRAGVKELMRAGRVVHGGDNVVMLPDAATAVIGNFRGHQRGFGFVVPESPTDHGDLFIPPGATLNAITGDTVLARITRRGKDGDMARVEGEIVEIVERGQSRFVGELVRQDNLWFMIPDGHALHAPVQLGDVGATRARAGDQIVVELTEFPSVGRPTRGVIVEVLGRRGDPGIDVKSIVRQHHFPEQFPEEVLDDARRVIREFDLQAELERREDLRGEMVVTIDPDEAKDFDDAISIRRISRGIELGVHIADVSTFVQPNRPLDREAAHRGNSIYLTRHVIPMLPEQLSNGLCSLQEGEPRVTKSAFIRYDNAGHRKEARFAGTVIQSNKRLTYRQAAAILDGHTKGYDPPVVDLLKEMERLAKLIQKRRLADGMIVLDIPEVELKLDDNNEVAGVEPAETGFPHTIIEMFMVEANEAVAELMARLRVPHLRRIHPEPPPDAQMKLGQFLRVLGKPTPKKMERVDMIRLLDSVRGKPESFAVNLSVLRSMAQAEYSPKLIGHFALASRHYSHFTSPIRRYPDLVIHRLLDKYLTGELKSRKQHAAVPSLDKLTEIAKHATLTERRAEAAERELTQVKVLRFLEKHVGDIEDGIVTGVTNVGLFVQLRKYLIDGLVKFDDLADDWWEINARGGFVQGQRSGKRIAIGDLVRVQIADVDIAGRQLNLAMVHETATKHEKGRRPGKQAQPRSLPPAKRPRPTAPPISNRQGSRKSRRRRGR